MKKNKTKDNAMVKPRNDGNKKNKPRDSAMAMVVTATGSCQKGREGNVGNTDTRILYAFDPTFKIPIVYVYGDFEMYQKLSISLFRNPSPPERPAKGYARCGMAAEGIGRIFTILVWINNAIPLQETPPTAMHEITHVSQCILDYVGVEDVSGEVQACIIEREYKRLVREFYGKKQASIEESVMKAMKEIVSRSLATRLIDMPKTSLTHPIRIRNTATKTSKCIPYFAIMFVLIAIFAFFVLAICHGGQVAESARAWLAERPEDVRVAVKWGVLFIPLCMVGLLGYFVATNRRFGERVVCGRMAT